MKKNAILFHPELSGYKPSVSGGLVFKVNNTSTYEEAYNELKDKLEEPEFIDSIVEDRCLLDDLFEGDTTYEFKRTFWNCYALNFEFENSQGDTVLYKYSAEFVYLLN